jgi:hypothetical protein
MGVGVGASGGPVSTAPPAGIPPGVSGLNGGGRADGRLGVTWACREGRAGGGAEWAPDAVACRPTAAPACVPPRFSRESLRCT